MLKKTFTTLFLVAGVMLFMQLTGCQKPVYNQLSDQEMTWLVYKNNEINTFRNGASQISYLVAIRTKAYQKDGDTYNEFTSAVFEQLQDTSAFELNKKGQLYIYKGGEGLLVTFSWPHFPVKGIPLNSQIPNAMNIGGVNYLDVYVLDATGLTDLDNYIEKIWYSKSYGVVQMQDASGDIWLRDF